MSMRGSQGSCISVVLSAVAIEMRDMVSSEILRVVLAGILHKWWLPPAKSVRKLDSAVHRNIQSVPAPYADSGHCCTELSTRGHRGGPTGRTRRRLSRRRQAIPFPASVHQYEFNTMMSGRIDSQDDGDDESMPIVRDE